MRIWIFFLMVLITILPLCERYDKSYHFLMNNYSFFSINGDIFWYNSSIRWFIVNTQKNPMMFSKCTNLFSVKFGFVGPITYQFVQKNYQTRANARYSICLHDLGCFRTDDIQNKHSMHRWRYVYVLVSDCNQHFTDYLANEFANPFYTSLTVYSFDLCLASYTSGIQCVGVGYVSSLTTTQCLLSKNNFLVSV